METQVMPAAITASVMAFQMTILMFTSRFLRKSIDKSGKLLSE
jgi:hypothetical protein